MNPSEIKGIYPMLYAFFGAGGGLDREVFSRQVEACIKAGSHGLAIGGLASECNKLTVAEKRALAEWTLEVAAGRVPVSVTITDNTVEGQIEAARHASDFGAGWVVLQPPPVKSASEEGLIQFFGAVADASPVPVGIQNAPEYIGIGLSDAGLIELNRRHPNVSILKAEGPSLAMGVLAERSGERFRLFNGRNGIELMDCLRAGFAGMIPGVETCDIQSRIFDNWERGAEAVCDAEFKEILPLLHFLMTSVDHLLCYGKRLSARRLGLDEVHDRGPAQPPHAFGLKVMEHWSKALPPFEL